MPEEYNYTTFSASEAGGGSRRFAELLHAGDQAPDFELPALDGENIQLGSFRGQKHIVLEFGSITWSPFVGEVSPINKLYEEYRDKGFEFFTVYVREPHPGEHYHEHRNWEEKLQYARDCREQDGLETTLLIDDLDGTVHRLYGQMPNMVYVILKDGRIAYRSMWTDHVELADVLHEIAEYDTAVAAGERRRATYTDRLRFIPVYGDLVRDKVFDRAGPKSAEDYKNAFSRT